jgi:hypothetical protein
MAANHVNHKVDFVRFFLQTIQTLARRVPSRRASKVYEKSFVVGGVVLGMPVANSGPANIGKATSQEDLGIINEPFKHSLAFTPTPPRHSFEHVEVGRTILSRTLFLPFTAEIWLSR